MQVVDLSKFDDEFVLRYGGKFNQINADVFSKSTSELFDAIKEICSIVNPEVEFEINLIEVGAGSYRALFKAISENTKTSLLAAAISLSTSLLGNFIYDKMFSENEEFHIIDSEKHYIIETNDLRILLPKEVGNLRKKIENNAIVDECVSKAFKVINSDPKIRNFGITRKMKDNEPIIKIQRSHFHRLSLNKKTHLTEESNSGRFLVRGASSELNTKLQIIRAIFEYGTRKWQFIWWDEDEVERIISAPIKDWSFYDKLESREHVIGFGDSLEVKLKVYNYGDWDNARYEVLQVFDVTS